MNSLFLQFDTPPIPYFVDCGRTALSSGDRYVTRSHPGVFTLIVVTKGTLAIGEKYENSKHKWQLRENQSLILRPDTYIYGTADCTEDTELLWVIFKAVGDWHEFDQTKDSVYFKAHSVLLAKEQIFYEKELDIVQTLMTLEQEPLSMQLWKQQSTFLILLQHLNRDPSIISDHNTFRIAEQIEMFIRQNYTKPISNTMLQTQLKLPFELFGTMYDSSVRVTPMEYLINYRIEQAKKLLNHTDWPVSRIAEKVGFNHASYFSTSFVNREGVSPSAYRANMTKKKAQ